ncbi:MAG: hypothetical protein V5A64_00245 [Candidatus Thermoplasmatota archaeon]
MNFRKTINPKYLLIVFAIIGITILYTISTLTQPTKIDLGEIQEHEGKRITTNGRVKEYYLTSYGNQIVTIKKEENTVKLFLETPLNLDFGDQIEVTGEVQKYQNEMEIIVDNNRNIKIIKKWNKIETPLWELATKPSHYEGLQIQTRGIIKEADEDYLYLTDANETYLLPIHIPNDTKQIHNKGQKIYLTGTFSFNKKQFRYEIKNTQLKQV